MAILSHKVQFFNENGEPLNIVVKDFKIIGQLKEAMVVELTTYLSSSSINQLGTIVVMQAPKPEAV